MQFFSVSRNELANRAKLQWISLFHLSVKMIISKSKDTATIRYCAVCTVILTLSF